MFGYIANFVIRLLTGPSNRRNGSGGFRADFKRHFVRLGFATCAGVFLGLTAVIVFTFSVIRLSLMAEGSSLTLGDTSISAGVVVYVCMILGITLGGSFLAIYVRKRTEKPRLEIIQRPLAPDEIFLEFARGFRKGWQGQEIDRGS